MRRGDGRGKVERTDERKNEVVKMKSQRKRRKRKGGRERKRKDNQK